MLRIFLIYESNSLPNNLWSNFYIYLVMNISIIDLSIFYGYHIFNLLPLWLNNIFHATVLFVYLRQFRITAVFFSM